MTESPSFCSVFVRKVVIRSIAVNCGSTENAVNEVTTAPQISVLYLIKDLRNHQHNLFWVLLLCRTTEAQYDHYSGPLWTSSCPHYQVCWHIRVTGVNNSAGPTSNISGGADQTNEQLAWIGWRTFYCKIDIYNQHRQTFSVPCVCHVSHVHAYLQLSMLRRVYRNPGKEMY